MNDRSLDNYDENSTVQKDSDKKTNGKESKNSANIKTDFQSLRPKKNEERTEVIYGTKKTTDTIVKSINNTILKWDNYTNSKGPSIAMGVGPIREAFREAFKKGIKIRFITEITNHNIKYCHEFMKIAEIRHIDNAKGGMAVSEIEYLATAFLQESKPVSHLIYSNVKEMVEQQHEVFESLWDKAIPAEKRILEIMEGHQRTYTKIVDSWNDIYESFSDLAEKSDEVCICSDIGMLKLANESFFNIYQIIMDKYENKHHDGIRWIVSVNGKEDVELLRLFMDIGVKIKNIKSVPIVNYVVTNKTFISSIDNNDKNINHNRIDRILVSNDLSYINHYKSIFEELWRSGTNVSDIIEDIDMGYDPERIDIISKSNNVRDLYQTIVNSAKKEIMIIFPSTRAFKRQHEVGLLFAILESVKKNNTKLKVMLPIDNSVLEIINKIKSKINKKSILGLEFRNVENFLDTKSTILIVDKRVSLVMELKDDSKDSFYDAIGLSTYSNSKAGVLSHVLFFENLWNQTKISSNLKRANARLKENETLQNDFIHIAAHELKTPLQPILMMSEIIKSIVNQNQPKEKDGQVAINKEHFNELLDIIIRNTNKLTKLTNNVLDITRIESGALKLDKDEIDIRKFFRDSIKDYNRQHYINNNKYLTNSETDNYIDNINTSLKIVDKITINSKINNHEPSKEYLVKIDKSRIIQVFENLIDNSLKFSDPHDQIELKVDKIRKKGVNYVKVTVKDRGSGIDPEILPKLFSKFITKSEKGTGLGLYICKNIILAHGGEIWASNNDDGRGASIEFTIPLSKT